MSDQWLRKLADGYRLNLENLQYTRYRLQEQLAETERRIIETKAQLQQVLSEIDNKE